MSLPRTDATTLFDLDLPVVQGPFGGLSTEVLVSAVSNDGGLGSYGAYMIPPEGFDGLATRLRALTPRRFALNLWVSDHDEGALAPTQAAFDRAWTLFAPWYAELGVPKPERPVHYFQRYQAQVDALIEARPPVFSFVFGVPDRKILAACRARDILTLGTATSIAEAIALEAAGVDAIVATGFEAGGHRVSFLAPAEESLMGTFVLTQLVADRVRIPVIAAGGIADARGVRAALTLGAQAAQIGTAFLACEESGTTDAHRALLFSDAARDTALTRAFSGRLARGLRNRWVDAMATRGTEFAPFPLQGWFMAQLRPAAIAAGRTDLVSLWGGQIAPNLKHRRVADLMGALRHELVGSAAVETRSPA